MVLMFGICLPFLVSQCIWCLCTRPPHTTHRAWGPGATLQPFRKSMSLLKNLTCVKRVKDANELKTGKSFSDRKTSKTLLIGRNNSEPLSTCYQNVIKIREDRPFFKYSCGFYFHKYFIFSM